MFLCFLTILQHNCLLDKCNKYELEYESCKTISNFDNTTDEIRPPSLAYLPPVLNCGHCTKLKRKARGFVVAPRV